MRKRFFYKKCFALVGEENKGENEEDDEDKKREEVENAKADEPANHAKRQAVPLPGPQVVAGVPSSPFSQGGLAAQLPAVSVIYDDK